MLAIYRREMRSYFTTSTGYVFLAISLALSGFMLGFTTLLMGTSDTSTYFSVMLFMLMIFLPILTMKIFSEEKRTKTEQLLLTAPIRISSMVLGKFLAAFTMFVISMAISSINFFIVFRYAVNDNLTSSGPNIAMLMGNMFALLLVGMVFIAIGMFVSSLTENQFAAVLITILILLFLLLVGTFNSFITSSAIRTVLDWLSIYSRFENFSYGMFDIGALIYYISVTGVFIFLTVRVFEARRIK
ncbi:MAG: ABC transporter permease [Eubacteriales bacterium]